VDSDHRHDSGATTNAEQAAVRVGPAERRVSHIDYDAELRLHNEVLRRAYGIRQDDRILDIGCGTGESTRDAARAAVAGSALGVDLSAQMIERARELSDAEGLRNVTYKQADAQIHRFPSGYFDIGISRFGTMFFADPVAAFANIGRALRPGARLVMMVWQDHDRNDWSVSIQRSLVGSEVAPPLPPRDKNPFSLADATTVERILDAAGFGGATFADVHEPVYYGRDASAALDFVRGLWSTNDMLKRLDQASAERALERLRETLAAHEGARGVWFDSRAWIVTARRR
jgi:SAM-dependent methyltransferase